MVISQTSLLADFRNFWNIIFNYLIENQSDGVYDSEQLLEDFDKEQVPDSIMEYFRGENKNFNETESEVILTFEAWLYLIYANIATDKDQNQYPDDLFNNDFFLIMIQSLVVKNIRNVNGNIHSTKFNNRVLRVVTHLNLVYDKVINSISFIQLKNSINDVNNWERNMEESLNLQTRKLNNQVRKARKSFKKKAKKSTDKIRKIKKKIDKQSEKAAESSITILGIFVGIVMVFFGGFTILENAIEGMQKASPYRLYFTMLLFGSIMYNVVILLFFLVSRITEKPVTCRCHRAPGYGSLSGDGEKVFREITRNDCFNCQYRVKNKGLCRIKNTLPYVYWGNLVIIMGLSFMFFMRVFRDNSNLGKFTCCQLLLSFLIVVIEFLIACGISKLGNASQKTKRNEK